MYQKTATLPRVVRTASRRRGLGRLLMVSVILIVLGSYVSPVRSYIERTKLIDQERTITEEISRQHEFLLQEREKLQNNEYIEQVARRDLGLVRPGEQPYVVKVLDQGQSESDANATLPEEPSLAGRITDWLEQMIP